MAKSAKNHRHNWIAHNVYYQGGTAYGVVRCTVCGDQNMVKLPVVDGKPVWKKS